MVRSVSGAARRVVQSVSGATGRCGRITTPHFRARSSLCFLQRPGQRTRPGGAVCLVQHAWPVALSNANLSRVHTALDHAPLPVHSSQHPPQAGQVAAPPVCATPSLAPCCFPSADRVSQHLPTPLHGSPPIPSRDFFPRQLDEPRPPLSRSKLPINPAVLASKPGVRHSFLPNLQERAGRPLLGLCWPVVDG